ncbi:MAG: hypothetical protein K0S10_757 [Rubrobacteraceae bacterium]|jgi:hypothetical protein|nr:hypothetical protein [Rubrobacteraceae bacterium]
MSSYERLAFSQELCGELQKKDQLGEFALRGKRY